jgi:hypothetical protein
MILLYQVQFSAEKFPLVLCKEMIDITSISHNKKIDSIKYGGSIVKYKAPKRMGNQMLNFAYKTENFCKEKQQLSSSV